MTREELLRILDFSDRMRAIGDTRTALAGTDARWNILSFAMRRHLEGKLLTVTSLAAAAGVPYGTAMRRIGELIDEGLLMRRPRSRTGRSHSLHPTRRLIGEVEAYAVQIKAMVGDTFGFAGAEGEIADFYFGGHYMASRILSYPNAMRAPAGFERTIRLLVPPDPTFRAIAASVPTLNELCGTQIEVTVRPLAELHAAILSESDRPHHDIVAVDMPWTGELAGRGAIRPLDDLIAAEHYVATDFHSAAWRGARWGGRQYGLPIQPTVELLFCRRDLFEAAGLAIPRTTDEVLLAARTLHRARPGLAGIVMNYGRGLPVAHSFVQAMADFGQPVIDLPRLGEGFTLDGIEGARPRPCLDTGAAHEAAEFLCALLPHAHPDSLRCDWDRRIGIFTNGEAAMCYGWSVRAARFEGDPASPAHGRVVFAGHPPAPGRAPVSPIGGFFLALPAHLPEARLSPAWKVMSYLCRPEMLKWFVQNGSLTSPRFSTSADPEVQATSRMIGRIDAMERRGEVQSWPRPPVPEINRILEVLGEEIHDMLRGLHDTDEALARAQDRIGALSPEAADF